MQPRTLVAMFASGLNLQLTTHQVGWQLSVDAHPLHEEDCHALQGAQLRGHAASVGHHPDLFEQTDRVQRSRKSQW
jgi:hypothetical protein